MATAEMLDVSTDSELQSELESIRAELVLSQAMNENSPINILLANTDLEIIYVNPASEKTLKSIEHLLPVKASEIHGQSIDIFHRDPSHQRRLLSDDKNLPHRAVISVGDEKLDLLVSAIYDAEGTYLGPMVTWEIVTKKIEMEEKNVDYSGQIKAIGKALAVIEFNMDGTIITANENFLDTLGYSIEEVQGRHHSMFVDVEFKQSAEYHEFWAKLNRGEYESKEYKRVGKGGKEVWIQASYNPIMDLSGKPFKVVKYATDVTKEMLAKVELRRKVDELLMVVNAAAGGDLTKEVTVTGDDAVGELAGGLAKMIADLREIIGQVVEGAAQFTEGSRVIAESAQTLAHGSQTQSASVEEMSASIEELTRSIEAVKDNASEANTVAKETSELAEEGGSAVQKSVEAMDLIKTSSEQISEIIQVISEIASQTNLLALNAAIEAARAGEHGLGFAVVADEVRKLAERSSEAAKEISSLIKESTQRVEDGATLSEQTGAALEKIIQGVEGTANKIAEIADATVEQAANATEVANAIQSISAVTEESAAGSEELASSSEELGAQAAGMSELVSKFKISNA
ncbi:MAG: PAS domain-containing protein [Planctomycetes bacterium]|nr:PAS domain-containing protein [Planctomycetota bacterium]